MDKFPQEFAKATYIAWHNNHIEPGKDLVVEIDRILSSLKKTENFRLNNLAELLSRLDSFNLLALRVAQQDISDASTEILLEEGLRPEKYNTLFKSPDSIIEKLWRKNKIRTADNFITSENIITEIGDLIRTSVITSTFEYAKKYADSILVWKELIPNLPGLEVSNFSDIEKIESQQEVKMQNGYFAYHIDIHYKDGIRIEVQIFSRLSQIWRHLSHKLYEKERVGEKAEWGHGSVASRLVSLGHLLHLAECEVEYLKKTMG
ncbi:hypothetical protein A1Z17_RS03335 [Acinetobacter baumannii]|nr:hypothetical protein [Acinetobacter baumannii]